MKKIAYRRLAAAFVFVLFSIYILRGDKCTAADQKEPNFITFSKIDKVSGISTGKGVKIAVLDWQFDLTGPEADKYIDAVSMVPGEKIGQLKPWHGEWMAEIIHTIAPDARIIPIKARGLNSKKYEDYLIRGIYYAADHGATAVTSSMGPLTQSLQLDSAIEYANRHGTIFINVHPETIKAPGEKARLCKSGECNSLIMHTGIISVPDYPVEPESNRDIYTWPYDLKPNYEDGWGYSNAPPIVAGVIALMKEANPSLEPEQIKDIFIETAYDYNGFRCLNAEEAVKAAVILKENESESH